MNTAANASDKKLRAISPLCVAGLAALVVWASDVAAFDRYSQGCSDLDCHGDFTGPTSPKGSIFPEDSNHEMHRGASYMGTDCRLCHTEDPPGEGADPFTGSSAGTTDNDGYGCAGCHGRLDDDGPGAGLRQRHARAGVLCLLGCHSSDATPVNEDFPPPYYGTVDTKVDMPCNPIAAPNTNENWTVGDFVGLDNDGDGLADGADPDCGATTTTVTTSTSTTATTSTTLQLPIQGTKLLIENAAPDDESRNKIVFLAKDANVTAALTGSAGDPRCPDVGGSGGGGILSVSSQTSEQSHTTSLPCENWELIGGDAGTGTVPRGYEYVDRELDDGTCELVTIRDGTQVRATCLGKGPTTLDYDLAIGQVQQPVDVVVTTGPVSHCARFGGEIKRNGSDGKAFRAVGSEAPPSCP